MAGRSVYKRIWRGDKGDRAILFIGRQAADEKAVRESGTVVWSKQR